MYILSLLSRGSGRLPYSRAPFTKLSLGLHAPHLAWTPCSTFSTVARSIFLPKDVQAFCNRFSKEGHRIYVVGGYVRDSLLGRCPKDVDVLTSAQPNQVSKLYPVAFHVKLKSFMELSIVKVGHRSLDVLSLPPYPGLTNKQHKGGAGQEDMECENPEWVNVLKTDALNRDFTCNSLFYDPHLRILYDFLGGEEDIEKRLLRGVGNLTTLFTVDPARLIRAVRTAAKAGLEAEPETLASIRSHAQLLKTVGPGRLLQEMRVLLLSGYATASLQTLRHFGLLPMLLPDLHAYIEQTVPASSATIPSDHPIMQLLRKIDEESALGAQPSELSKPLFMFLALPILQHQVELRLAAAINASATAATTPTNTTTTAATTTTSPPPVTSTTNNNNNADSNSSHTPTSITPHSTSTNNAHDTHAPEPTPTPAHTPAHTPLSAMTPSALRAAAAAAIAARTPGTTSLSALHTLSARIRNEITEAKTPSLTTHTLTHPPTPNTANTLTLETSSNTASNTQPTDNEQPLESVTTVDLAVFLRDEVPHYGSMDSHLSPRRAQSGKGDGVRSPILPAHGKPTMLSIEAYVKECYRRYSPNSGDAEAPLHSEAGDHKEPITDMEATAGHVDQPREDIQKLVPSTTVDLATQADVGERVEAQQDVQEKVLQDVEHNAERVLERVEMRAEDDGRKRSGADQKKKGKKMRFGVQEADAPWVRDTLVAAGVDFKVFEEAVKHNIHVRF